MKSRLIESVRIDVHIDIISIRNSETAGIKSFRSVEIVPGLKSLYGVKHGDVGNGTSGTPEQIV